MVKARKLLHESPKYIDPATGQSKYAKVVKGACGAHTWDLFIGDVLKMPCFHQLSAKIKRIVSVIYNHDILRDQYQNQEGGKRLSRFVDSRFGIMKIMAEDVKQNRNAIGRTIQSEVSQYLLWENETCGRIRFGF